MLFYFTRCWPSSKTIILKWVFHINAACGSHLSLLFSPAYPSLTLPYPLHPFAYISKPLLRGVFRGFSGSIHPNESVYVRVAQNAHTPRHKHTSRLKGKHPKSSYSRHFFWLRFCPPPQLPSPFIRLSRCLRKLRTEVGAAI